VTALLAERDRALLVTANGCRLEIRCTDCGYGGGVARLPDRCPMCGARRWQRIRSTPPRSDGSAHPGTSLTRPGQSAICS
jgi:hypothetical protein